MGKLAANHTTEFLSESVGEAGDAQDRWKWIPSVTGWFLSQQVDARPSSGDGPTMSDPETWQCEDVHGIPRYLGGL